MCSSKKGMKTLDVLSKNAIQLFGAVLVIVSYLTPMEFTLLMNLLYSIYVQ